MSAEIINLRQAKKARTRAAKEADAAANRAKFGRTKTERTKDEDERARRDTLLDGAKIETSGTDLDPGTVS